MSVRPLAFHPNGSIDVIDDDHGHAGTVTAADLDGAQPTPRDHLFLVLPCPVAGCGSATLLPIGGGAAPAAVQELFVRMVVRAGCPCGQLSAGRPVAVVQAHIKLQTQRLDGPDRWEAGVLH